MLRIIHRLVSHRLLYVRPSTNISPTMSGHQSPKQAVVIVKPRPGNKSAHLTRSIERARIKRKVPTTIGAVDCTANLETGEGFRMKKPFTFADLSVDDLKKIADWLANANSAEPKKRPGFESLDSKMDQVLSLLTARPMREFSPAPAVSTSFAPASPAGAATTSALDRIEVAIEEAIAEVRELYDLHASTGVRLTNVGHASTAPRNPDNAMDQLQARVNRLRFEVLVQFPKGCQRIGIIKKGAGEK